jgi:hypothetical protein
MKSSERRGVWSRGHWMRLAEEVGTGEGEEEEEGGVPVAICWEMHILQKVCPQRAITGMLKNPL